MIKENEPNLFGEFVAKAKKLIDYKGFYVSADEADQDDANILWNEFVRAYDAINTEFTENLRKAIESGQFGELSNGRFLRKPTILDSSIIDEKE